MNVGNLALRFFGVLIGVRGVSRTGGATAPGRVSVDGDLAAGGLVQAQDRAHCGGLTDPLAPGCARTL